MYNKIENYLCKECKDKINIFYGIFERCDGNIREYESFEIYL